MYVFTPQTSSAAIVSSFKKLPRLVFKASNTPESISGVQIIDVLKLENIAATLIDFLRTQPFLASRICIVSRLTDKFLPRLLGAVHNLPYTVQIFLIAPVYLCVPLLDMLVLFRSLAALALFKVPSAAFQRESLPYVARLPPECQLDLLRTCYLYFVEVQRSPGAALQQALRLARESVYNYAPRMAYVYCRYAIDCRDELEGALRAYLKGGRSFVLTECAPSGFWLMLASQDNYFADAAEFVLGKVRTAVASGVVAEEAWMAAGARVLRYM